MAGGDNLKTPLKHEALPDAAPAIYLGLKPDFTMVAAERALQTKTADMAVEKYNMRKPESAGGGFDVCSPMRPQTDAEWVESQVCRHLKRLLL
ncbi:MAG: hypothetical protein WAU68_14795 [Vitreimonas sp.]